ncbi:MAG: coproporphyrinogen III oxidase [Rhodospirillales bacterium]|nr:coproporphyrinogen III oxidase [Rhodospirillales bacterium]
MPALNAAELSEGLSGDLPLHGDAGFGVYVHWPFCRSKCPYCDFNSHVAESVDHARWRSAYLREIDHMAEAMPGRRVTSVFFGGGTPSLMPPATVDAIIARIRRNWPVASNLEVTLEANPTSVEAGTFAAFRDAGVNRVSLGVQALDEDALRFLGRHHSADEALAAVELAARTFSRYSFDLIYGRPGQTVEAWRDELERARTFIGGHLSLYQLTIETGTPFHRNGIRPAPEDLAADLYDATQEVLEAAGLPAYEISNHARAGEECRHNLTYWQGGEYAGIGPGAHGRTLGDGTATAAHQIYTPDRWLAAVETQGHATAKRIPLDRDAWVAELLMGGLRLTEGIARDRFRRLAGRALEECLADGRVRPLVDGGFLRLDRDGLRATAEGRIRLNALLSRLLA